MTDETGNAVTPWGAYLLFVRWGHGEPEVQGHLETDFLATGSSEGIVRHQLGAMTLAIVKATLDGLIRGKASASRPWWEVARDEGQDGDVHS